LIYAKEATSRFSLNLTANLTRTSLDKSGAVTHVLTPTTNAVFSTASTGLNAAIALRLLTRGKKGSLAQSHAAGVGGITIQERKFAWLGSNSAF
jgi:hypothetical protein